MRLQARIRVPQGSDLANSLHKEHFSVRKISGGAALVVDLKRASSVTLAPDLIAETYPIPALPNCDLRIEVDESLTKSCAIVVCNSDGSKLTPAENSVRIQEGRATFRLTKPFIVIEANDDGASAQRVSFIREGDLVLVLHRVIAPGLAAPGALMEPMVAAVTKWSDRHTKVGLYYADVPTPAPKPHHPIPVAKAAPAPKAVAPVQQKAASRPPKRAAALVPEPPPSEANPDEPPSDEPAAEGAVVVPVN